MWSIETTIAGPEHKLYIKLLSEDFMGQKTKWPADLLTCILTETSNLKDTPSARPYNACPDSAREEGQRVKMK